jgi:RNA polymerase sigma factor (sigma-70 family)
MALEQIWSPALRLRPTSVRAQAARHDAATFESVYEHHHQALYRYCRSMLRNEEDAHDALQSTMTKALAALRDEERDFELRPWLFRIAHNEAVSRLRQRRETVSLEVAGGLGADSLPQAVEDRERIATLRADLRDLPERQRAALVLRELCGLGHQEIAAVLDTTASAVKQSIFEARTALHEFDEGRAMVCAEVQRALSDGDGRVLRARRMRAHVRSCKPCRRFKARLAQRPSDLAALAPALPASAGGALLTQTLVSLETGGAVAGIGTGVATTLATKAAMIAATVATAAGATAVVHSARERAIAPTPAVAQPASGPAASPAIHPKASRPGPAGRAPARRAATPQRTPAVHHRTPPAHRLPGATADAPPVAETSSTTLPAGQAKQERASDALPPGQAKKQAATPAAQGTPASGALPPGQAKKQTSGSLPPGQAKKQTNGSLPPGQAKKQTNGSLPPGQANKQAAAQQPASAALPPGQAKQQPASASPPPGQAKQQAASDALPPGQAKQ